MSGTVFSDLDGDGLPGWCWRVSGVRCGCLGTRPVDCREVTQAWGLAQYSGLVERRDDGGFGRGRPVGHCGVELGAEQSVHVATSEHPALIYYGDLGGSGAVDVVEAEFESELNGVAPRRYRDPLRASLPWVGERFPTHKAYSEATIEAVLGEAGARARVVEATTLASMVFLNRGGHFEAVELPPEAQLAPAFGVNVADFDGDGNEDVFLSQNFFASEPGMPRLDAGRGVAAAGGMGRAGCGPCPDRNRAFASTGNSAPPPRPISTTTAGWIWP